MSSNNPELFIIAGPNGAGKSVTSESLLKPYNLKAFDWDKEFYSKWAVFGYDPLVEQGVRDTTNNLFKSKKESALKNQNSFAFETNFHLESILDIAREFRDRNFNTYLYFLLITDVEICKSRVEERVKVDRGHPVSEQTIEQRFNQSLDYLNRNISLFDKVFLYNASSTYDMTAVVLIENGNLVQKVNDIPVQLKEKLPIINELLKDKE